MNKIFSFLTFFFLMSGAVVAQIIPDSSLGAENSVVNSDGDRDTINGGAIRNANLFHSFQEFNVGTRREAYFTNPDGIDNIFSRVTGNNISDIQGVLGVLGNANLYLINPNGILLGKNARLDVSGSLFATTADSVLFGNGTEFSAVKPNKPPLLTVDIPINFQFRDNPESIIDRSTANGVSLPFREEAINVVDSIRIEGFNEVYRENRIDASQLIAQNVCTQTANSEFINIGKGGLPSTPDDVLTEENIEVGLVAPVTPVNEEIETQEAEKESQDLYPVKKARKPPAQGWIWREYGTVELVAYNPEQLGDRRTWDNPQGCK